VVGKRLGVPVWDLLGGKVREKIKVYAWIGGDRPSDVETAAKARLAQKFSAVKMNATGCSQETRLTFQRISIGSILQPH
jgi:L-alanine-DL-glutamate epimerase-like enolase superfamily enzyme